MQSDTSTGESGVGEMHKRRITLGDGRYLIFFTFGDEETSAEGDAVARPEPGPEPVTEE